MEIITWNIQVGRGADDRFDIDRIAAVSAAMGDPDIICYQEVGQNFPGAGGGHRDDQVAQLAEHFPDHEAFFGPALDRAGEDGRARFGNLILSRAKACQFILHSLPQPADPSTKNMPRQACELLVEHHGHYYRVITTHLEYFSPTQRLAQTNYLRALGHETTQRAKTPALATDIPAYSPQFETARTLLCGDFNFAIDSAEYQRLCEPGGGFFDAWRSHHGSTPHAPTCGIFDHKQWQEGAHCRDFFFVTEALTAEIATIEVNVDTNASDHQPVRIVFAPG